MTMNRRDFIKTSAAALAAAAVTLKSGKVLAASDKKIQIPDLVVVRNGDPVAMFRKGIEELGGMTAFVKPGQSVVVKPNMAWDKKPEEAANTNPELVAEIIRQALAAGASRVDVFDNTCNEWSRAYKSSGIAQAAANAGAKVLPAHLEEHYAPVERPKAVSMKKALIHKAILDADVFINVPVLKHHGGAQMTAAMKNFMGIVWDRQYMHRNNLPQSIADSALYRMPDLNVIDAYRVMVAHGPRGVSAADITMPKYQLLSRDIVAIDVAAAKILEYGLDRVPYIQMAHDLGLGEMNITKLKISRLEV